MVLDQLGLRRAGVPVVGNRPVVGATLPSFSGVVKTLSGGDRERAGPVLLIGLQGEVERDASWVTSFVVRNRWSSLFLP